MPKMVPHLTGDAPSARLGFTRSCVAKTPQGMPRSVRRKIELASIVAGGKPGVIKYNVVVKRLFVQLVWRKKYCDQLKKLVALIPG